MYSGYLDTTLHCNRVANLARQLALFLDMPTEIVSQTYLAGLFHDVGKYRIPSRILEKRTSLTKDELFLVKLHPMFSYEIAIMLGIRDVEVLEGILYHHESFNGKGYPMELSDYQIPFIARVLSICDVFDALMSQRHYKNALGIEAVLDIMQSMLLNGKFDKYIYIEFLKMLGVDKDVQSIYIPSGDSWCSSVWLSNLGLHKEGAL